MSLCWTIESLYTKTGQKNSCLLSCSEYVTLLLLCFVILEIISSPLFLLCSFCLSSRIYDKSLFVFHSVITLKMLGKKGSFYYFYYIIITNYYYTTLIFIILSLSFLFCCCYYFSRNIIVTWYMSEWKERKNSGA